MKYQIELTKDQVEYLSMACEIVARLGMGQIDDALRELPGFEIDHDILDLIRQLGMNPCGIAEAEDRHRILWDIYQVLRHELAWQWAVDNGIIESMENKRKWPEMIQVWYDDPCQQGTQPLCKIKKAKKE